MKILTLLVLAPALANAAAESTKCPAPAFCREIQASYSKLQEKPGSEKEFRRFLSLLRKSAQKNCTIQGVRVPVPGYRVCYDNGFTTKVDGKGQPMVDQSFAGPVSEETVQRWFVFAEKSKFPAGKKFTRGKAFQSTLDGSWAELFSDE